MSKFGKPTLLFMVGAVLLALLATLVLPILVGALKLVLGVVIIAAVVVGAVYVSKRL